MENMNQLKDLLKHELEDLHNAEQQIIDALPEMIENANNQSLKEALSNHLDVTERQKARLEEVLDLLSQKDEEESEEKGGFLSGLFGGGEKTCKAMEGIIKEGKGLLKEDMSPEVLDAAIIAAAQKVEHYEIASYGTARTWAMELGLTEVESLLRETLDEEYEADDLLTALAESRINLKAIPGKKRSASQNSPEKKSRSTARSLRTKSSRSATTVSSKRGKSSSAPASTRKASTGRSKNTSSKNAPARKRSGGGRNR